MLFIDCREGISSDMLLAAMLALVEEGRREVLVTGLASAASARGVSMSVIEVEDAGEEGLGVSYAPGHDHARHGTPYREAASALDHISRSLGSGSEIAMRILDDIARAEAAVHGCTLDELHLHEVARPEALVTIAGIGHVHSELASGGERFMCSTITTGKGVIVVSHGAVRVPAPATRVLLEGLRHLEGPDAGERATPSGVAALRAIISGQCDDLPKASATGVGFGTRVFGGRLGRVRLLRA